MADHSFAIEQIKRRPRMHVPHLRDGSSGTIPPAAPCDLAFIDRTFQVAQFGIIHDSEDFEALSLPAVEHFLKLRIHRDTGGAIPARENQEDDFAAVAVE